MGHRRFGCKSKTNKEGEDSTNSKCDELEHDYTRTPNPKARNYLDEMAPVNGIRDLKEDEYNAVQEQRDTFRDLVSKRMGELLLRGVTMLDAYCQTCNGILMEDRSHVRNCVSCDLFKEQQSALVAKKNPIGANIIAELPLDVDLENDDFVPATIANRLRQAGIEVNESAPTTNTVRIADIKRDSWAADETRSPKDKKKRIEVDEFVTRSFLPGLSSAVPIIDAKIEWIAKKLEATEDLPGIRDLLVVIREGAETLKVLTGQ